MNLAEVNNSSQLVRALGLSSAIAVVLRAIADDSSRVEHEIYTD
jgi:hypothetical protein